MAYIQKRVTEDGVVSYRVQVRLKGFPMQTATFERKTDASRWATVTEAAMREKRRFKTSESSNHTAGELIKRYMEDILPKRGKDRKTVEGELKWWKSRIGVYLLADITPQLLADLLAKLEKEPIKSKKEGVPDKFRTSATIIRYLASLSVCLSYAVKDLAWLESNPALNVRKPKLPKGRLRFLDADESKELLEWCKKSDYKPLYTIVVLALSTGARKGEIMGLRWKDVDFKNRVIRLEDTKNKESRSVPVSSHAYELLLEMSKVRHIKTDLLFAREDGKKGFDLRKHWKAAVTGAKLKNFKFHDLRHTAASNLAMNGATLVEISEILGHKQMQMVKRYAHLTTRHTAAVLERMNKEQFSL